MTPKKPRKRDESVLLAQIRLAIGSRPDVTTLRINTGVYAAIDNPKRRIRSAPTGTADLCLVQIRRVERREVINPNGFTPHEKIGWFYYSQLIWAETKTKKGVLSDEQRNFAAEMTRLGCICIAPRCVEDVIDVLGPVPEWAARNERPVK